MQIAQFVLIGVGAGVLSGMFGIGGGLVIVPFLAFVVGMQLPLAIGTSLGALLLPVGILGVIEFFKNGNLDIRAALIIAAGLFIGTFFGAKIVTALSPLVLRRIYALFLAVMAVRLWVAR